MILKNPLSGKKEETIMGTVTKNQLQDYFKVGLQVLQDFIIPAAIIGLQFTPAGPATASHSDRREDLSGPTRHHGNGRKDDAIDSRANKKDIRHGDRSKFSQCPFRCERRGPERNLGQNFRDSQPTD